MTCQSFVVLLLGVIASVSSVAQVALSSTTMDSVVPTGSELREERTLNTPAYRLVLSELKHQQTATFGERERRLAGELTRRIYDLPRTLRLAQVWSFFTQPKDDHRVLYECIGVDCGSSHFWANQIFSEPRLVSRDKDQAYQARISDEGRLLTVVYVTMRGGRQPQVVMDELRLDEPFQESVVTVSTVRAALSASAGWLPGVSYDGKALIVAPIVVDTLMNLSAGERARLQLIVHCYEGKTLAETKTCSDQLSKDIASQLPGFQLHSHGALTPAPGASLERAPGVRFLFWPGR